ncbi:MAG: hypothetical protein NW223_05275 [Hyphomicrobiaceae bacterium]|nr:hypothetical protein [Hyphomicrobiaceae bacterium]
MLPASRHLDVSAKGAVRWLGRASLTILYAAPLAWVACLAALASAVAVKVGHFPSYSNPDPKHVPGLGPLYEATVVLLFLAALSPLVIGALAGTKLLRAGRWDGGLWTSGIYLARLSLAGAVVFGDAFGLMTWLLD